MLIISTLFILISNAVTLRRDMAILFNRVTIISLLYAILQSFICLSTLSDGGIGLHGGLFHVTTLTQIFHIFLYLISILILQLTSFYPSKFVVFEHSSASGKDDLLFLNKLVCYRTNLINKMGEHLKIIEYPAKQSGKLLTLRGKLPNSGDFLNILIPNLDDLFHGG
jgi:NADH-ubiquinone oxidoreductase chain 2